MDVSAYLGIANLSEEQLQKLQALENELGVVIIAMRPSVPVADLTPEQVKRIQQLETELDAIVLACKPG